MDAMNPLPVQGLTDFYDAVVDLCALTAGTRAMHKGLFGGSDDAASPAEGADRLTRLAGEHLALSPRVELLDIGCGMGQPALLLAEETGCSVTGTDIAGRQVETARRLAAEAGLSDRVTFHRAEATALPFPDSSFHRVLMMEMFTHLPDTTDGRGKQAALREAARCLRPGGPLVLIDMVRGATDPVRPAGYAEVPSVHVSTTERLKELLDTAGFDVGSVRDLSPEVRPSADKCERAVEERRAEIAEAFGEDVAERMVLLVRDLARTDRELGYVLIAATVRKSGGRPHSVR
ncbi:hypothetical protein CTZ27_09420 [Streptomyces griseocarneus]|nr:hypothetical protein CTZ27_09420 [Streptomyces griseocarneus]